MNYFKYKIKKILFPQLKSDKSFSNQRMIVIIFLGMILIIGLASVFFSNNDHSLDYIHPGSFEGKENTITPQSISDFNVDHKSVDTTFITFKDSFEYNLDSGMVWKIRNQNDSLIYSGVSSINSIVFPLPGVYVLDLNQPVRFGMDSFADSTLPLNHDLCNHSPFPDELVILVSDTHLKFDFSTIRFNKELSGGSNSDVILTLDGHYEQFSESELNREDIVVIASGVGANLKSKAPKVDAKLINGNNSFSFQLSGSLKSNTYIQLDFYVPKQIIQSYSHLTKIK